MNGRQLDMAEALLVELDVGLAWIREGASAAMLVPSTLTWDDVDDIAATLAKVQKLAHALYPGDMD